MQPKTAQGPAMAANAIKNATREAGVTLKKVYYNLLYYALMASVTKDGKNYGVFLLLSDKHWSFISDELPKGKLSGPFRLIEIPKKDNETERETRERAKAMMRRSLQLKAGFPNWQSVQWSEMCLK